MKNFIAILICSSLLFTSCELLDENGTSYSNDEIVEGLKTALAVGTDSSTKILAEEDGYYKNPVLKLMLPPEADIIVNNIGKVPGGQKLLDDVILRINRAAEQAADSAGPIFKKAITSMSISDGLAILNGENPEMKSLKSFDSTAATGYLRAKTYSDLVAAFSVPINKSLDEDIMGFSTNDAWNSLTTAYNKVVDLDVLNLLGLHKVNVTLGEYATQKALDGLFFKVGETEVKIRRNPWLWVKTTVGDILTKIFG